MISVTRRYHFPASHRLHSPRLSKAENARLYGKCNNPFGHGHDYTLELTVTGELAAATGLIVPVARLDAFVREKILRLFAYRNINVDVPQFARRVPTTENVVAVIAELVVEHWAAWFEDPRIYVSRIQIQETGRNGFALPLAAPAMKNSSAERNESVTIDA